MSAVFNPPDETTLIFLLAEISETIELIALPLLFSLGAEFVFKLLFVIV